MGLFTDIMGLFTDKKHCASCGVTFTNPDSRITSNLAMSGDANLIRHGAHLSLSKASRECKKCGAKLCRSCSTSQGPDKCPKCGNGSFNYLN